MPLSEVPLRTHGKIREHDGDTHGELGERVDNNKNPRVPGLPQRKTKRVL